MTTFERLLRVLSAGGWHSTEELVREVGHRFSATMHVAKQRGYRIEKRRVDKNQFEYRLLALVPSYGEVQTFTSIELDRISNGK